MTINMEVWAPVPVEVFGLFLGLAIIWIIYRVAKFFVSIVTGTS